MVKFTYRDGVLAAIKHVANTPWKSRQATVTGLRELANTCPSCDTAWTAKEDLPCPKCGSNNSDELERELVEALSESEKAEGVLINQWADFWDVAPQPLIDSLMKAQTARNAVLAKAKAIDAEEK